MIAPDVDWLVEFVVEGVMDDERIRRLPDRDQTWLRLKIAGYAGVGLREAFKEGARAAQPLWPMTPSADTVLAWEEVCRDGD